MLAATRLRFPHARRAVVAHLPPRPPSSRLAIAPFSRCVAPGGTIAGTRSFAASATSRDDGGANAASRRPAEDEGDQSAIPADELTSVGSHEKAHEHAVISTFDLFSIGGAFVLPFA